MNKRDKFAMAAMQAIVSKTPATTGDYNKADYLSNAQSTALGAYFYADAMIWAENMPNFFELAYNKSFGEEEGSPEVSSETDGEQREHPCKGGCEACVGCNAAESNYETENNTTFKPFNIQVETKGQAELIASLLGGCHGTIDNVFGVNSYAMYEPISEYSRKNVKLIELNN